MAKRPKRGTGDNVVQLKLVQKPEVKEEEVPVRVEGNAAIICDALHQYMTSAISGEINGIIIIGMKSTMTEFDNVTSIEAGDGVFSNVPATIGILDMVRIKFLTENAIHHPDETE